MSDIDYKTVKKICIDYIECNINTLEELFKLYDRHIDLMCIQNKIREWESESNIKYDKVNVEINKRY